MILFDPIGITQALAEGAEALRASVDAPSTLMRVERGALTVEAAAGVRNLETGRAADAGQTFEIGSQTKMMTAVVILQMVERGEIDLDARAADYLPAATVEGIANADTVTVRQLLNMTSGIPNFTEVVDANGVPEFINALLQNPDQVFGPEQSLDLARGLPALSEPGTEYYYSNTNYTLLGQIIEAQTGRDFYDVLQAGIFDPVGMGHTVRQLGPDPLRLSSYATNPLTGERIDVTNVLWEMRGEAGVASTNADMAAFLRALIVDKTLLGPAALAEMMDFLPTGGNEVIDSGFGLGLARFTIAGGDTWVGFTGGTLATASSTYVNTRTGEIIGVGATSDLADTLESGFALSLSPVFDVNDDGSPLHLLSGSAAALRVASVDAGIEISLGGASLTLDRTLGSITTQNFSFADGSVLVVGDNRDTGTGDRAGNTIDIARDFAAARDADNQLLGLGGNDSLRAAAGDDRVLGGTGNDLLAGRDGADTLSGQSGNDTIFGGQGDDVISGGSGRNRLDGGDGDDVLRGGQGRDTMTGGAGADRFVFTNTEGGPGHAVIADFETGTDVIDLRQLSEARLDWIGEAAFSGTDAELRAASVRGGIRIEADLDGDGTADFALLLRGAASLAETDVML